jgi:hypothetical protein
VSPCAVNTQQHRLQPQEATTHVVQPLQLHGLKPAADCMTTIASCTPAQSRSWRCLPVAPGGVSSTTSSSQHQQAWRCRQANRRRGRLPSAVNTSATPPSGCNGRSAAPSSSPPAPTTTTTSSSQAPTTPALPAVAAAVQQEDCSSSQGDDEALPEDIPDYDLWTPRPHPPHIGHKRQLAALLLATVVEFSITGGRVFSSSPQACIWGWGVCSSTGHVKAQPLAKTTVGKGLR